MVKIHAEIESRRPTAGEKFSNHFDPGIFAPLFLNLIRLKPGQAVFLPARRLHSYLHGLGIELMGDSDNVVRCALTSKHIDSQELVRVVRYKVEDPEIMEPEKRPNGEIIYETPTEEFVLSFLQIESRFAYESPILRSIEILLCTKGSCVFSFGNDREKINIKKGDSFLIPASAENYQIRGDADLFKATIPVGKMQEISVG